LRGLAAFKDTKFIRKQLLLKRTKECHKQICCHNKQDGTIIGHLLRELSCVCLLFLRRPSLSWSIWLGKSLKASLWNLWSL